MKIIKVILYFILAIVILFIAMTIIGSVFYSNADEVSKEIKTDSIVAKPIEDAITPPKKEYLWRYVTQKDEMDNSTDYFATLNSDNQLNFKFPYSGGSTGVLTLRNMNKQNSVALRIDKGQFMPSYSNDRVIRVKFDDAQPINFTYSMADDGSSDYLFPNKSNQLIRKIKNAKTIKIEAPFFGEGRQILIFTTEGLKWDK